MDQILIIWGAQRYGCRTKLTTIFPAQVVAAAEQDTVSGAFFSSSTTRIPPGRHDAHLVTNNLSAVLRLQRIFQLKLSPEPGFASF